MLQASRILALLVLTFWGFLPAHACTLQTISIARTTGPFFVFEASPDTLPVPMWTMEREPPEMPSTFGQLVRITRLAPGDQPETRAALERSRGRAVLVPWAYSSDCRTIGWRRSSFRWITSSVPAFLSARLRPQRAWANGVPTFDVYTANLEPFPHDPWLQAQRFAEPPQDQSQILTAAQYFQMYSALPTHEEWKQTPERSLQRIREWVAAHPRLAARYPASTLLGEAEDEQRISERQTELERLREIRPPLAGTYRFIVRVDGDPGRTFFIRTRARANSEWIVRPREIPLGPAERVRERDGYSMYSTGSLDLETLPQDCSHGRQMQREGYLYVLETPEAQPDRAQRWQGKVDLELVARQFPADTVLKTLARLDFERFAERDHAGQRQETPALFIERPDGSVTVEQLLAFANGRRLSIRGERVSTTSIACTWQ